MKVKIDEIRKKCEKILTKNGLTPKNAQVIVNDYLEGELLGKKSHGLAAFVAGHKRAIEVKKRKIKIEKNKPAHALINGNHQVGQLVAEKARNLVIRKAKKYGIAMVATYNAHALLRPGSQAEQIAKENLIGIVLHNGGGPAVPPWGGIDPILATNPIGYAIPTSKQPLVLDMATSKKAWGEVRLAKQYNHDLPKETYLNKKGNFAKKPDDVYAVLPFGEYKGFALALLFEILTGSLVKNGVGLNKDFFNAYRTILNKKVGKAYRGALFIAIDPSKFVSLSKFKKENTELINQLKKSRKRKGVKKISMPEEASYQNKQLCLKRGWVEIEKKIINEIEQIICA